MKYPAILVAIACGACAHQQSDVQIGDLEHQADASADTADLPNPDVGPIAGGGSNDLAEQTISPPPPPRKASAEVISIDSHGAVSGEPTSAETDGPRGGPGDGERDPVLEGNDAELWLELPESPSVLMLGWPLPATGITSPFGERADPIDGNARFHYGLDLEAQYGQVIKAAAAGRVVAVGFNHGHGRQIVITHAGGYRTGYSHLSQTLVYEGQIVEAGEAIGTVGTSGRTTGPHLHFEVTRWGTHVDPMSVLGVALELKLK